MAKGYSARRGFSNGSGQMLKQQQMQQQIMKMQEDMQKAQQEVEEKTFSASVGGGVVSAEVNGGLIFLSHLLLDEALHTRGAEHRAVPCQNSIRADRQTAHRLCL